MSKQDSHFFNNFSLILGILVAVTIGLFVFARHIGAEHQGKQVTADKTYEASVKARLAPVAQVAVSGNDAANAALEIKAVGPGVEENIPADGTAAYKGACFACHDGGIGGAPKFGDKATWGPRIRQGKETLYDHAIHGFTGKSGVMPAKGGRGSWPDDLIKQAVDHMVEAAQ